MARRSKKTSKKRSKKTAKKRSKVVAKASPAADNKEDSGGEDKSGLTIDNLKPQESGGKVKPGKRLYLTANKKALVYEGDPRAAFLYCTEHSTVSKAEFKNLKIKKPK